MRRCWDQWIREVSFTRRPGSGHPQQTSRHEDRYIVRNASVQPTGSLAAIQSAKLVPRQLGRFDCVLRRCWNQWMRVMSFTRKPGSGRPRQTSRHEDRYIVRNAREQPTGLSAAIQVQVASSLRTHVSS
ncbi:transposable element Tcb2 transposase [Trichonephila clavipes]|nr:transposable element Tcb2 transposase [Trichonephila clavipes]